MNETNELTDNQKFFQRVRDVLRDGGQEKAIFLLASGITPACTADEQQEMEELTEEILKGGEGVLMHVNNTGQTALDACVYCGNKLVASIVTKRLAKGVPLLERAVYIAKMQGLADDADWRAILKW